MSDSLQAGSRRPRLLGARERAQARACGWAQRAGTTHIAAEALATRACQEATLSYLDSVGTWSERYRYLPVVGIR